jgi:hypothetical protein
MRLSPAFLVRSGVAAALVLSASAASAHIDLLSPLPRYPVNRTAGGDGSKSCPCGDGDSNRVCSVPAADSHDPNRSERVTTLEAGSMLTVRFDEYINHTGRFRIAFDPDGADLADFNLPANVLLDEPDTLGAQEYTFTVQVPNTPCDNCTLQVIQDMNAAKATAPATGDPAPDATYYTCADIRIVPAGTLPTTGGAGAGGSASGGTGGASATGAAAGAAGASRGGASGTAAAGAPGNGASADPEGEDEDDGCSFGPHAARFGLGGLAPLALLLVSGLRRKAARANRPSN